MRSRRRHLICPDAHLPAGLDRKYARITFAEAGITGPPPSHPRQRSPQRPGQVERSADLSRVDTCSAVSDRSLSRG